MKIQKSAEDYLEMILILEKRLGFVRSIDIATELGFSKPSVSVAMKNLRMSGYIDVDAQGGIHLLDSGREIAERMLERHTTISGILMKIGVSAETAADDACKIEHVISAESFDAIKRYAEAASEKEKN